VNYGPIGEAGDTIHNQRAEMYKALDLCVDGSIDDVPGSQDRRSAVCFPIATHGSSHVKNRLHAVDSFLNRSRIGEVPLNDLNIHSL